MLLSTLTERCRLFHEITFHPLGSSTWFEVFLTFAHVSDLQEKLLIL